MKRYPDAIRSVIEAFAELPGVGFRTAEKYVYWLLRQSKETSRTLGNALLSLTDGISYCTKCYDYSDQSVCRICRDTQRDKSVLCIVAHPYDIPALEQTGYQGLYFVLGGELAPLSGIGPEQLRIRELIEKIKSFPPSEIILACNPDKDGEATAVFIAAHIHKLNLPIQITRLAKGLALGSAIEYADEVSLAASLENRTKI